MALRYADNFWGEQDNGFDVMLNRMRQGKLMCKELVEIFNAHAAIEEDYARKLQKLAKMAVGKVGPGRSGRAPTGGGGGVLTVPACRCVPLRARGGNRRTRWVCCERPLSPSGPSWTKWRSRT